MWVMACHIPVRLHQPTRGAPLRVALTNLCKPEAIPVGIAFPLPSRLAVVAPPPAHPRRAWWKFNRFSIGGRKKPRPASEKRPLYLPLVSDSFQALARRLISASAPLHLVRISLRVLTFSASLSSSAASVNKC